MKEDYEKLEGKIKDADKDAEKDSKDLQKETQEKLKDLTEKVDSLDEKFMESNKELEAKIQENIDETLKNVNDKIRSALTDISETKTYRQEFQSEMSQLEKRFTGFDQRILEVKEENDKLKDIMADSKVQDGEGQQDDE